MEAAENISHAVVFRIGYRSVHGCHVTLRIRFTEHQPMVGARLLIKTPVTLPLLSVLAKLQAYLPVSVIKVIQDN
jgi:hypothetical protein